MRRSLLARTADPLAVPPTISDRQFAHGLAKQGIITQGEAIDFVATGTVPAALQAMIDAITDPDARFDATMLVRGAVEFRRASPFVEQFAVAYGWSPEQADDFWRYAASL